MVIRHVGIGERPQCVVAGPGGIAIATILEFLFAKCFAVGEIHVAS
jgi:hypothetical protein